MSTLQHVAVRSTVNHWGGYDHDVIDRATGCVVAGGYGGNVRMAVAAAAQIDAQIAAEVEYGSSLIQPQ
jgi:hypothetical protein